MIDTLHAQSVALLKELIATPSFSKDEAAAIACVATFFNDRKIPFQQKGNNIWATQPHHDNRKPTLLLNSHIDTVKPNSSYTIDPFAPIVKDGKLYGLGSNDAGGPLVSLIAAFLYFYEKSLPYNLLLAITAEEEISGTNGIEYILPALPPIAAAIVGEPTLADIAIAEKGLLVLDCVSAGKAGHAAREEGDNAIYRALPDIHWFQHHDFPRVSPTLGKVKMSVTVIHAGQAHNQTPEECKFTVDIRVTDEYALEEILETARFHTQCRITPRSLRIKPSRLPKEHPLMSAAVKSGKKLYGSPTSSDQALIPAPSIKMGPGDSARSHSADEFIYIDEIKGGIVSYIRLIELL